MNDKLTNLIPKENKFKEMILKRWRRKSNTESL